MEDVMDLEDHGLKKDKQAHQPRIYCVAPEGDPIELGSEARRRPCDSLALLASRLSPESLGEWTIDTSDTLDWRHFGEAWGLVVVIDPELDDQRQQRAIVFAQAIDIPVLELRVGTAHVYTEQRRHVVITFNLAGKQQDQFSEQVREFLNEVERANAETTPFNWGGCAFHVGSALQLDGSERSKRLISLQALVSQTCLLNHGLSGALDAYSAQREPADETTLREMIGKAVFVTACPIPGDTHAGRALEIAETLGKPIFLIDQSANDETIIRALNQTLLALKKGITIQRVAQP